MITAFLDRFTTVHHATAKRREPNPNAIAIVPIKDTMYILKHGKKASRAMKAAAQTLSSAERENKDG
jgi:hypothetical protein